MREVTKIYDHEKFCIGVANFAKNYLQETPNCEINKTMNLELHLGSRALPASVTNRIKACGGKYTHVRGNRMKRFVTVPIEQSDLIEKLVREFHHKSNRVAIVARHGSDEPYGMQHLPAWVDVQYVSNQIDMPVVAQFQQKFDAALAQAHDRKLVRSTVEA